MNLKATIARLKVILLALEYTSGQKVFAPASVRVSTGRNDSGRRPPECLILIGDQRPYATPPGRMKVVSIDLDCAVAADGPDGEAGVIDGNRSANATQGAGLESLMAKVIPAVRLIDTDSGGSHTTWTRIVSIGSPVVDGVLTRQTVSLESLCEVV